jgi:thioredoxin-like negative regulator of GroEL
MFPGVAQKAQQTIAPITHVPFIILYVNGRPFMRYNGKKTYEDISTFVNEVLSRIQSKRNFSSSPSQLNVEDNDIPEYASGIPFNMVCEGETCYLTFNEAYKK